MDRSTELPRDPSNQPGRPRTVWTEEVRAMFLAALARSGSVSAAAGAAGVSESVVRYHRDRDPQFADEIETARQKLEDELTDKVREWATRGVIVKRIKNDAGELVYEERKLSERLLLAWLRRQESGSWAERVAVDQKVEGKVQHEHRGRIEVEHLTPEQRRKARDFLASLN